MSSPVERKYGVFVSAAPKKNIPNRDNQSCSCKKSDQFRRQSDPQPTSCLNIPKRDNTASLFPPGDDNPADTVAKSSGNRDAKIIIRSVTSIQTNQVRSEETKYEPLSDDDDVIVVGIIKPNPSCSLSNRKNPISVSIVPKKRVLNQSVVDERLSSSIIPDVTLVKNEENEMNESDDITVEDQDQYDFSNETVKLESSTVVEMNDEELITEEESSGDFQGFSCSTEVAQSQINDANESPSTEELNDLNENTSSQVNVDKNIDTCLEVNLF